MVDIKWRDYMCIECNIKSSTVVGSVVINVRRCKKRPVNDRGAGIVGKLFYVTKIASRGEGVYGHVINETTGKLQKTQAHIRDCEFELTNYKWENGIRSKII